MNEQYYRLSITTIAPAAAHAIHEFAEELVSHGSGAKIIFDALSADPECALAHAYAAALFLTQMTREGHVQAAPHIASALDLIRMCSARESATIDAIAAWGRGDERRAVSVLRGVVECDPYDLVAAKFCQILELNIGDISGMVRTSAMAVAVEGRSSYALGLHAYALEQAGQPSLALRYARSAVDRNPKRDPWAQHALAHALVALDQPYEARAFLHAVSHSWERCSSFMLTHNWWHLALLELELGNRAAALVLFDEHVWGVRKGHTQDQINAISLLLRLEIQGVRPSWRWNDIVSYLKDRVDDRINGFLDLHYLIALARNGSEAEAASLAKELQNDVVAGAIAKGILSHAHMNYREAAAEIAPARQHFVKVGGSNIQREMFEAIFVDSVTRSNAAQTLVDQGNCHVAA
jgi:tetratricopeptide (TPR) repeat protein